MLRMKHHPSSTAELHGEFQTVLQPRHQIWNCAGKAKNTITEHGQDSLFSPGWNLNAITWGFSEVQPERKLPSCNRKHWEDFFRKLSWNLRPVNHNMFGLRLKSAMLFLRIFKFKNAGTLWMIQISEICNHPMLAVTLKELGHKISLNSRGKPIKISY